MENKRTNQQKKNQLYIVGESEHDTLCVYSFWCRNVVMADLSKVCKILLIFNGRMELESPGTNNLRCRVTLNHPIKSLRFFEKKKINTKEILALSKTIQNDLCRNK
jgi:hypothetical protein